ncbi:hypothetical protein [uncultured Aquimarina sp.]|uniref:hypothetical protein n=1 Tax=uncultured Aquimarina sp. TaxID=575652 RepID=UPI002630F0E0|nr:hypothetical protein [uncultured Aquimarina sp.]
MKYIKQILTKVRNQSPILYGIVMLHLTIAIGCIIGLFIDDRTVLGVNTWIKPLKFSISIAIYIFTVGYLISLYPYSNRKKNILSTIVSWTLLIEMLIIGYQASQGVQSHYNESNVLSALLFLGMGIMIAINVLIMILFIFDTIRLKLNTTKSIQWAILIGWIVIVVGSWIGGQMINQLSHSVGVVDGGTGLPLVNWSTVGGDLRIAHFFGLHGIQIIPLFALWVSKKWKITNRKQIIAVTIFGLSYASWIGFVFYQAKQGIPLISL